MLFTNSIKFPNIFSLTSGNTTLDGEYTSINRCIALILTTAKGELLGDPDYGCTLYERLFNNYTEELQDIIKDDIVDSINRYEKRVIVTSDDINITPVENTEHSFNISISYKLRNSDISNEAVITMSEEDSKWTIGI